MAEDAEDQRPQECEETDANGERSFSGGPMLAAVQKRPKEKQGKGERTREDADKPPLPNLKKI